MRDDDYREHQEGRQTGHDGAITKGEVNRFARDAFTQGADALANAEIGKTKKVFGFEVDAGIADWFDSIYNLGADYLSTELAPRASGLVHQFGHKVGLSGNKLQNAAVAADIGSTFMLKTARYFSEIVAAHKTQYRERAQLARKLAPVLDEIKGGHSLASLYSVSQADNEVIYAHRQRLAKIANTTNMSNWVNLAVKAGPNLMMDWKRFKLTWNEKRHVTEAEMLHREQQERVKQQLVVGEETGQAHVAADSGPKNLLRMIVNTSSPQLAGRLERSGQHRLNTTLQPYSALEMILELNEQVASKPDARQFQLPHAFNQSSHYRDECSLEEYLMRIFIQHQKEMADISPNHTEIREALREDLAAVVKPMAAALRKGDMSVMSLVRLVGEGRVVKKQGRGIAAPDDVMMLIKREAPKQSTYANVDPAEYYKDAPFTRSQFKAALKSLDGEEKLSFAAMFPDAILAEAGMSKKEIKHVREATLKGYDQMLAEAIVGLDADAKLKKDAMAESEARHVHQASVNIQEAGVEAVKEFKANSTDEGSPIRILGNAIVSNPQNLGRLVKAGHEQMKTGPVTDEDRAGEMADAAIQRAKNGHAGHAEKHGKSNGHAAAVAHRREIDSEDELAMG